MTISNDRRNLYVSLSDEDQIIVDDAYMAVDRVFAERGQPRHHCDHAENLVGAIARFLVESRCASNKQR